MNNQKIFILGLDGADYHYVKYLMKLDVLPNLKKIAQNGIFCPLRSTEPPNSFPAWTSFSTGVNPGKHGIFYPAIFRDGSYRGRIVKSTDIKVPTIWRLFSEVGVSVGLINLPMTYPPHPINGFMVTSILTPGLHSNFTYPENLKFEILKKFPNYQIETPMNEGIDKFYECAKIRKKLITYLFDKYKTDIKVAIFTELDRIQHKYWNNSDVINNYYVFMDQIVGELWNRYGTDSNFIIVSDHGFGPSLIKFNVNVWLKKLGLLEFNEEKIEDSLSRIKTKFLEKVKPYFKKVFTKLCIIEDIRKIRRKILGEHEDSTVAELADKIDWTKTKAYFREDMGIRINLRGREVQGIVPQEEYYPLLEYIITEAKKLKDEYHGHFFIKGGLLAHDIYQGEMADFAPDLQFKFHSFYNRCPRVNWGKNKKIIELNDENPGRHMEDGIFLAIGPVINNNFNGRLRIIDVAPNILFIKGLNIPKYMDGKIVKEIYKESFLEKNKISFSDLSLHIDEEIPHEADAEEIKSRLKDLGYM